MNDVSAIIRWIPAHRGGRARPPEAAESYSTVARFESDVAMTQGVWSLQLHNVRKLGSDACVHASVRFLNEAAPVELLREGERFELLEGRRVVAKCVVISPTIAIPPAVSEFDLALLG